MKRRLRHRENDRLIGIAGERLDVAKGGRGHHHDDDGDQKRCPPLPGESETAGLEGVDLAITAELIEAQHDAEQQTHRQCQAGVFRDQIGDNLEKDGQWPVGAEDEVQQPEDALQQQYQESDEKGQDKRFQDPPENVEIEGGHSSACVRSVGILSWLPAGF